ncbi:prepilin peptidase [Rubellimicrobium roseum]|uniref:Prepilin type IV endopeptidase peptidase domain-containing protein n=1 Tax=Rubellimicrobium roseum TaxID=687525 RepID=A0A5C4NBB9_9RHOB|nr:prepilin peptidase [Rubellimicrobium roseum]TNC70931.1 hypothetical protein FHG71_12355 [Rubellimicrobium roseum]
MGTPPDVALAFLLGAVPVSIWAGYVDLSRMKIPNKAVLALLAIFVLGGLLLLPLGSWTFADWAWRLLHLVVVLLIGMGLNAIYLMGAGDAKFAAAAAPFIAFADLGTFAVIFLLSLLSGWLVHRLFKWTIGPRLAPDWVSWTSGKRFPMGVGLGLSLVAYLALAALG